MLAFCNEARVGEGVAPLPFPSAHSAVGNRSGGTAPVARAVGGAVVRDEDRRIRVAASNRGAHRGGGVGGGGVVVDHASIIAVFGTPVKVNVATSAINF